MDRLSRWKLSVSACCAYATAARCWRSSGVRPDNDNDSDEVALLLLVLVRLVVMLTMVSAAAVVVPFAEGRGARGANNKLDNRLEEGTG